MLATAGALNRRVRSKITNAHISNAFKCFLKTGVDTRRCSKSTFTNISNVFVLCFVVDGQMLRNHENRKYI